MKQTNKKNRKAPNKQQKNKNETKHETPLNIMIVANAAITLLEKRPDFFSRSFFPVVLWLHSHLSSCLHLIATVGSALTTFNFYK